MAPIITQSRSTGSIAAPFHTKRALNSHNDVSLAIGLTISSVCFVVVILVTVWWLLRRRSKESGAITPELESPGGESSSYKCEGDAPPYSPQSLVAPSELDTGVPRNDISQSSQSSPVSNSLLRYTPPNGESSSASVRTSPFNKEYCLTEPDRRSHPSNIGFDSRASASSIYPKKQEINLQINFVNPRDVEYRPNRVLQAEEHAIFLSLYPPQPRSRPTSIQDRPPHYPGMDISNTDVTKKGSSRTSPSPTPDHSLVPRISTLYEKLTDARRLQELHSLTTADVSKESSHEREETGQKQRKRPNQRNHTMATSSSSPYTTTPSHSNKSSPISATTTTSPSTSISSPSTTTSHSPTSPSTPTFPCPSCRLTFRTPGLRRNHHNRRHNLRYTCIVCTALFGLRADLDRHQYTRHPEQYRAADRFWCTVEGCKTPDKEWNRKDNFERHVRRCEDKLEKRRAKGKGKERVG